MHDTHQVLVDDVVAERGNNLRPGCPVTDILIQQKVEMAILTAGANPAHRATGFSHSQPEIDPVYPYFHRTPLWPTIQAMARRQLSPSAPTPSLLNRWSFLRMNASRPRCKLANFSLTNINRAVN